MDEEKLLYRIALTLLKGVGPVIGGELIRLFGDADNLFAESPAALAKLGRNGIHLAAEIQNRRHLLRAEKEVEFICKHKITPLYIHSEQYPDRIKELADAPILLYYLGNQSLQTDRSLSIIGTRKPTAYGLDQCEKIIREVAQIAPKTTIVSGLAYGIDIHAHRTALQTGMPTVAVLAHGLDRIYPAQHRKEATQISLQGGLLTEYLSKTEPERYNFVARNRLVAMLTPATIVIESKERGGSLITAEIAHSYGRELFALPGRTTDQLSEGCNRLIAQQKAILLTSTTQLAQELSWEVPSKKIELPSLFESTDPNEAHIVQLLHQTGAMHLNDIVRKSELPVHIVSSILFDLELKEQIRQTAGGLFSWKS